MATNLEWPTDPNQFARGWCLIDLDRENAAFRAEWIDSNKMDGVYGTDVAATADWEALTSRQKWAVRMWFEGGIKWLSLFNVNHLLVYNSVFTPTRKNELAQLSNPGVFQWLGDKESQAVAKLNSQVTPEVTDYWPTGKTATEMYGLEADFDNP